MQYFNRLTTCFFFITILFSSSVSAALPDGFTLDHGYTYFTIESVSDSIDGKRVDLGWKLSGQIRIYGDAPDRSSIKLALKKDDKVVAERRTRSYVYKTGDPVLNKAVNSTRGRLSAAAYYFRFTASRRIASG